MKERKPFDPALRQLFDEQAAAAAAQSAASGETPSVLTTEARVRMSRGTMVRALENRTSIMGLPNAVETRDLEITFGLGVRLYLPPGDEGPRTVLVYLHGGGWAAGSISTHDPFCRLLSEASGVIVAALDYRLAPEHPYPAALEDTLAAVRWAAGHAGDWGGDPSRVALGGDSAGANLAAVTANRLCATGELPSLAAQLLLYPVTDHPSANHASYTENATGYGLEASAMRWFWEQYAPDVSSDDPSVSPLRLASVPALPPTLVATTEYDVLRDEGIAYAEKLKATGTAVTHLHAPDMSHNFPATPNLVARFPQCRETLATIAGWLKRTLSAAA